MKEKPHLSPRDDVFNDFPLFALSISWLADDMTTLSKSYRFIKSCYLAHFTRKHPNIYFALMKPFQCAINGLRRR